MRIVPAVVVAALVWAGCASTTPPPSRTFSGTVWTWDTDAGTVTLMQDSGRLERVRISPDQFTTLRQHQYATVQGQLVSSEMLQQPPPPMTTRARGVPDHLETAGTVATVDPSGRIGVTSARGAMELWVPVGADQRFQVGAPVRVRVMVQPLETVPATSAPPPETGPVAQEEPGDYSQVIGRVLEVYPNGALRVDAPNRPIVVVVPDARRYRVNDTVEVRTSVHPGP